jgi:RNA polymerase sigma-70 factor, ECF subfamily
MSESTDLLSGCADDELVSRAQASDDQAFAELVRRTSSASLKLAVSILRDREEAEDEVQNSYLKAWRHVGQFQREAKFSTWISRIVVNQCLMRLRKVRRVNLVPMVEQAQDREIKAMDLPDHREGPEAELGGRELAGVLKLEIQRLPPRLRDVLVMRDVDELSTMEVAARLGISAPAVKSRLLRARAELRNRLEKYQGRTGWATLTA